MSFLIVFYDGGTTMITGCDLETALFLASFDNYSSSDIVAAIKIDTY